MIVEMFVQVIFLAVFYTSTASSILPACESLIYCRGELLHTIQLARLFGDSKTFVDKKLTHDANTTLQNFQLLLNSTDNKPTKVEIQKFVDNHFADGDELEEWNPPDFQSNPAFLNQIKNATVKNFTKEVISLWPLLARKMNYRVALETDRHSFIPVPNGFIIPGGRFKETYYWDSYWIIKGLLLSEMTETARGIVDNFVSMVERFGFIPNGGRVYYLNRSQPPLFTAMAFLYYKQTNDVEWLRKNLKYFEKELKFWLEHRTISVQMKGENITLARYFVNNTGPRPESYAEDVDTASYVEDLSVQQNLFANLKSGAESGWDFSSRWIFDKTGRTLANLSYTETIRVIPVDLNAFLCGAFQDIAQMYLDTGDVGNSMFWSVKAREWRKAVMLAFWNEDDGIWYDLDLNLLKPRKYFYPSSFAPLWARCYEETEGSTLGTKAAKYLKKMGILDHLGGIPTSLDQTGEQWDFPNSFPPLEDIVVQGLELSGSVEAREVARTLAKRWVDVNIIGFKQSGEMFEKYDAVVPGGYGGGGEYNVQTGFGWTNGVVLKFIYEYFRDV